MNEIDQQFNFNDPVEVTEIFRVHNDNNPEERKTYEYSGTTVIGWEDVKMIKQYPYPDDWKQLAGEKYYLSLHGYTNDLLILGSHKQMTLYWKAFRNTYPIFIDYNPNQDD